MQLRQKWLKAERDLRVGDVVLLMDELTPRNLWKRGIVIEVFPSKDDRVRKVRLRIGDSQNDTGLRNSTPATTLVRPVHKLVLLLPVTE